MYIRKIQKLINIMQDLFFIHALFKGSAAGTEHVSVLKNMNIDFIVDVGANRGQFALIARKIFPDSTIHSFEPLNEPAKIFKSIFDNDINTHLYQCAIGSKNTRMKIHVSVRDDSSSLLPIGNKQSELFPHTEESETRTTLVLPLYERITVAEITNRSLLKIDVQGFELEVLKGCESILNKFSYVYVECSFIELYEGQALAGEVINFLSGSDFMLNGVYNMSYDHNGKAIQADFLFKKISPTI